MTTMNKNSSLDSNLGLIVPDPTVQQTAMPRHSPSKRGLNRHKKEAKTTGMGEKNGSSTAIGLYAAGAEYDSDLGSESVYKVER